MAADWFRDSDGEAYLFGGDRPPAGAVQAAEANSGRLADHSPPPGPQLLGKGANAGCWTGAVAAFDFNAVGESGGGWFEWRF
jgi:hypothetical protein